MTRHRPSRGVIAAALALASALTLWTAAHLRPPVHGVVVITLDTTRADRLPVYGFDGVRTPAIDRVAREGVVFDDVTSVAPLTFPAHASLFTGNLPLHHGVRDNAGGSLPMAQVTLAERLHARGWRTAAFVSAVVLRSGRGLDRGFDRYSAPSPAACPGGTLRRRGDRVVTDALDWLAAARSDPFFLWIHLYDAHRPYELPAREPYARSPYLGAISFLDEQIGRVLTYLDREGLARTTAVVIAGDHGEGLGDHGEQAHGIFVYQSVLHVPLLMHVPGVAPRRVLGPTSLVDVMPTLLELTGLPVIPSDGVSLAAAMRAGASHRAPEVYAESLYPQRFGWSGLRSLRDERYKVIAAPRAELYDLQRDPVEQSNIIDARPAVARAMLARLAVYDSAPAGKPAEEGVDSQTADELAALGYVGAAAPQTPAASGSTSADPKDHIAEFERFQASRLRLTQACTDAPSR
ncbi:MAG TPA: sulfatase [Gemmatimonadaceae bacterium]|nr:sulfatase [Vicinamibacterales bacterium]